MKNVAISFSIVLSVITLLFLPLGLAYGQNISFRQDVSINDDDSAQDDSAILDVKSTTKGVLVPRMTTVQRGMISSPATGLLVFDITSASFWFHDGSGWEELISGGSPSDNKISDLDNNTQVQTEESANEDVIRFDLGGIEQMVLTQNASNQPRLELNPSGSNVIVGQEAGASVVSGQQNVAIGRGAMTIQTDVDGLVAIGDSTLSKNFHLSGSFRSGKGHTAVGYRAMASNTTGGESTAFGYNALSKNQTNYAHTAIGYNALANNTGGHSNTAVGWGSLELNTGGYTNTGLGTQTLQFNTSGSQNVAVGNATMYRNINGFSNTAIGYTALFENTSGDYNSAVGLRALYLNTTGHSNVALGAAALYQNTIKNNLVAIGDSSLYNNGIGATAAFHATENTAVGSKSLTANNTGYQNTGIGFESLINNNTGYSNTAVGARSLFANTTGNSNVGVGLWANYYNETGARNTALGFLAGRGSPGVSKSGGVFIGYQAGLLESGNDKLYIENTSNSAPLIYGDFAIDSLQFNSNVRINPPGIGYDVIIQDVPSSSDFRIATSNGSFGLIGEATRPFWSIYSSRFYASSTSNYLTYSDQRLKENIRPIGNALSSIMKISPIKYDIKPAYAPREPIQDQLGFIAQDIEKIYPEIVNTDAEGIKSVGYIALIPILVKGMQEQQEEIKLLKQEISKLKEYRK